MILFQQARKFLLTISLVLLISTATAFGFASEDSWAATSPISSISQPHSQIAWGWGKAKAVTKDIEGKTQETMGNITGNRKDQVMGKVKQAEGQGRNTVEDVKDSMRLKGRAKAVTTNVEGKLQEAAGNITGNSQDQVMGKAKQVESQVRNAVEDMKDMVK